MGEQMIELECRDGIAHLRLNRPAQHNALSPDMLRALEGFAKDIAQRGDIRAVLLEAVGRSFCAGGDLAWMQAQLGMDRATRRAESARLARALGALYDLPQPLICRVQGNAFGGGIGLMSVCDIVLAAEGTRYCLTEVKLGLTPANIGPYVVAKMGAVSAAQVFFNARVFGAQEAQALGLVAQVVPPDALDAAVQAEVDLYQDCAPGAVREAKALLRRLAPAVSPEAVETSTEALAERWDSAEARDRIAAFFAKRSTDPKTP